MKFMHNGLHILQYWIGIFTNGLTWGRTPGEVKIIADQA